MSDTNFTSEEILRVIEASHDRTAWHDSLLEIRRQFIEEGRTFSRAGQLAMLDTLIERLVG